MKKRGKKYKKSLELLGGELKSSYSLEEGVKLARQTAYGNFDESFTVNVKLGINPDKSDHAFRGSVILPYNFKKDIKVIAFARGEQSELAKQAGAEVPDVEELIEKILGGWRDFDYAVSTPDIMGLVGKTAKVLGPKGLLPNKKNNTVALNLVPIIKELKSGLKFFKNTKDSHVHFTVGKKSQVDTEIIENMIAFFKQLRAARPNNLRGTFLKKVCISTTMGLGIPLNIGEINK